MHIAHMIAADAEAQGTIYAEACERYAVAEIRSSMSPDNHRLYARSMELWIARDYVWRELLANIGRLRDAGEEAVAENMLRSAVDKSQVAQIEAMRRELATMKGAA
jgi:hypothetical protein